MAIVEFKSGSGVDKLHEVKMNIAKMGEVNQLGSVLNLVIFNF